LSLWLKPLPANAASKVVPQHCGPERERSDSADSHNAMKAALAKAEDNLLESDQLQ
jgi:hypothetical protein